MTTSSHSRRHPDQRFKTILKAKLEEDDGLIDLTTAGGGIEYAWGKLKFEQRKENDGATKLESAIKFIERVRKLCKN